jgi:hypothetical protein
MPRKSATPTATAKSKKTPPKAKPVTQAANSGTNSLGLSDLHLRYAGLEQEHKKILKQIKTKQTEIDKLTTKMQDIMQEVATKSMPIMQKVHEADAKIHELFKEILEKRKFGKKSKSDVRRVYLSLQTQGIISANLEFLDDEDDDDEDDDFDFDPEFASFFGEGNPNSGEGGGHKGYHSFRDMLENTPQIDRDEQKKMRQVFLRLAEIFHPDKCLEHDLAEHYAEIMKEVNQAYQSGDFAKLLAIEKQYQAGQAIDLENESDLDRRCQGLEHQNSVLKNQYERLKTDLRMTKSTQEGQMATEYTKIVKTGINPIDVLTNEVQEQLDITTEVLEFVQSFYDKKITIKKFMEGPEVLQRYKRHYLRS